MNLVFLKKAVALLILTLLAFSNAQELLQSPSFGNPDGWNNCGDASNYSISSGELSTKGTACIFQTVEASEGSTYTLMCHPRSTAAYSTIALSMLNSNSATILQDVTLVDSAYGKVLLLTKVVHL